MFSFETSIEMYSVFTEIEFGFNTRAIFESKLFIALVQLVHAISYNMRSQQISHIKSFSP